MPDQSQTSDRSKFHWDRIKNEHFMQCFDEDEALVRAVGSFLEGAIERKQAAIIVGTVEHISAVERYLQGKHLNPLVLQRAGQYIPLDAAETLERICVEGRPNQKKFFEVIGGLISRAHNSWGGVRAFGEMVNLLWQDGKKQEALELEDLWNQLAKIYPFALFCAYSKDAFDDQDECFSYACEAHSMVIL
jgi:hypothetical protein